MPSFSTRDLPFLLTKGEPQNKKILRRHQPRLRLQFQLQRPFHHGFFTTLFQTRMQEHALSICPYFRGAYTNPTTGTIFNTGPERLWARYDENAFELTRSGELRLILDLRTFSVVALEDGFGTPTVHPERLWELVLNVVKTVDQIAGMPQHIVIDTEDFADDSQLITYEDTLRLYRRTAAYNIQGEVLELEAEFLDEIAYRIIERIYWSFGLPGDLVKKAP